MGRLPALATRCALFAVIGLIVGCRLSVPVVPPLGAIFTHVSAPLTVNYNDTAVGSATKRVSESSTIWIFDFLITGQSYAFDEAAISRIARDHGIEDLSFAEYEFMNVLGLFQRFTVHVYGN